MSVLGRTALFGTIFVVLQCLWIAASGSALERLVIDQATVAPAANLIRLITPEVSVVASGSRLTAPSGGINVLKGCEGTEVLFMLVAAFAISGLRWRDRLAGLALGTGLVYVLNQLRLIGLFYAYRQDRALFDFLHGTAGPLVLVALVGLFFVAWLHRFAPERNASQAD